MKKIILVLVLFLFFFGLPCQATEAELKEKLDTNSMYDSLSSQDRELLSRAEIDGAEDAANFSWEKLILISGDILRDKYLSPLKILLFIIGIIIISSFLGSYNTDSESFCQLSGALAICALITPHMISLITDTKIVCEGISVFMLAAVPVYVSLLVASGNILTGSSYGGLSIVAANLLSQVSQRVIIPALSIFMGLSISSVFAHINIKSITESVYNLVKWLMIFAVTAFSGIISVQSVISGATDAATLKTARLVASAAIPIVGGAFSDGVTAVQHSLKILKSGAGAFGIIATIVIFLSPAIQALLWMGVCQVSIIVTDLFDAKKIGDFLNVMIIVLKMILAVLLSLCVVSIVTAAITLFVGA